jgi:hypothetical protein
MDKDHGFGPGELSSLRNRSAMIAIGRAGDCHSTGSLSYVGIVQFVDADRAPQALRGRFENKTYHRAAKTGEYVSGTLVGSTQLASSRFAMIDNGIGFQLVPWQPVLDKRIGQHITGTVRAAGGIEWSFGRKRGLWT